MLRDGAVGKVIASLAIPTIIITLVMTVYNMADLIFIGKTGNQAMYNAIAVCMPVFTIIQAFGTLVGTGGCTAISVALGRKDSKKGKQVSSFAFYFCIVFGLLLTLGINLFANPIVKVLGAEGDSVAHAITYLRVLSIGCPIMMFSNSFVNILRADGSVKESMMANLTGTILNLILDPIMILGFGWGVAGAAIATVIGNVVAGIIVLMVVRKKTDVLSIKPADFTMQSDVSWKTLGLGVPVAAGTLMLSVGYMIINNLLKGAGADFQYAQSAFSTCRNVMLLSTMIQLGICMGVQPAVSYNYGQNNSARVKEFIKKTTMVCIGYGLLVSVLCIGFRDKVIGIFNTSPDVLKYGRVILVGCLCTAPIYAIYQSTVTFLQATERPFQSTLITLLRQGGILIPAMLLLNAFFGWQGLAMCFAVTDAIAAIIGGILLTKRLKALP